MGGKIYEAGNIIYEPISKKNHVCLCAEVKSLLHQLQVGCEKNGGGGGLYFFF
jgi:hypothetical protein